MTTEACSLSVGIDCGSQYHQVCVLDRTRAVVAERRVEHNGRDLHELADWLLTVGEADPSRIWIAIEVPRGPVVETLLERGFPVYAINPKQLDRFRERYSVGGAKDDRRDAWVLASAVQSDRVAFRAVQMDDPAIIQLRELSRLDAELGEELTRSTNRLRDQLHRYFPALLRLCPRGRSAVVVAAPGDRADPDRRPRVPAARPGAAAETGAHPTVQRRRPAGRLGDAAGRRRTWHGRRREPSCTRAPAPRAVAVCPTDRVGQTARAVFGGPHP
jgi:hypothetical protein